MPDSMLTHANTFADSQPFPHQTIFCSKLLILINPTTLPFLTNRILITHFIINSLLIFKYENIIFVLLTFY